MEFAGQHIISADQFDQLSLERLFEWARRMRGIAQREVVCNVLEKYDLGSFFFEESTRTRLSSERAFRLLGGHVCTMTDMKFSSIIVKGEDMEDTFRVLSHFCDIMVVRCKEEGQALIAAENSKVPVINGGDGKKEHPTQALLDVFTIKEENGDRIDGLTIAMVGDLEHSRTVHSLVKLLTLYCNITFLFVAPAELQIPAGYLALIEERGHRYEKMEDLRTALPHADVFYMVRPQNERMADEKKPVINGRYQLTKQLVEDHCKPNVIIHHPLPRNDEISKDVDSLKGAAYFKAIDNGILIRMALFILVLGKEKKFV